MKRGIKNHYAQVPQGEAALDAGLYDLPCTCRPDLEESNEPICRVQMKSALR
jgi:hypothetical protein